MDNLNFDIEPEFWPIYERCKPYTMTGLERMYALWCGIRHIHKRAIPGDIVECGVWRGGSMLLAALTLKELGDVNRRLWLYDTFDGMTGPTSEDVQHMSGENAADILAKTEKTIDDPFWAFAPIDDVKSVMKESGYPEEAMQFVVGKVEDTIPNTKPETIALLRLDTDWYESTKIEMELMYPQLEKGGVLIIDDYGYWRGAKKAVDEYFEHVDNTPFLSRVDFTGRVAIKP